MLGLPGMPEADFVPQEKKAKSLFFEEQRKPKTFPAAQKYCNSPFSLSVLQCLFHQISDAKTFPYRGKLHIVFF